jgi:hypothetical protein
VVGVVEDDDGLLSGVGAGDLDRVLDRLGAGVEESGALLVVAGSQSVQCLGYGDVAVVRRHHEARVGELRHLLSHGPDHPRSAVADRGDGDAGPEVDQMVAVHVDDDTAGGALGEDRHGRADACGDGCVLALHEVARARAGQFGDEPALLGDRNGGGVLGGGGVVGHGVLLETRLPPSLRA